MPTQPYLLRAYSCRLDQAVDRAEIARALMEVRSGGGAHVKGDEGSSRRSMGVRGRETQATTTAKRVEGGD